MESRTLKVDKMACPKSGKIRKFETSGKRTVCLDSLGRNLSAEMEEKETGDRDGSSSQRFYKF